MTDTDPVRETLPTLFSPDRTTDEMLHGLQWLAALKALVAEAEDRIEAMLKGRPKHEVEGVGSYLTTTPSTTPEVYDADALAEWCLDHPEVGVEPVERDRLNVDAVRQAVDTNPALLHTLESLVPGARITELLLPDPDKVAKDLAKRYATRDSSGGYVDGDLVASNLDSGEPETIPGVRVRTRSKPKVQVRLDKAAVGELRDSLMSRYGLET